MQRALPVITHISLATPELGHYDISNHKVMVAYWLLC